MDFRAACGCSPADLRCASKITCVQSTASDLQGRRVDGLTQSRPGTDPVDLVLCPRQQSFGPPAGGSTVLIGDDRRSICRPCKSTPYGVRPD